jgi:phage tail-like protein
MSMTRAEGPANAASRPTWTAIEALLPAAFQRSARAGGPLGALLGAMEALHAPSEAVLRDLDVRFDPYRAPEVLVPLLARWVGLDALLAPGGAAGPAGALPDGLVDLGRLRALIAAAARLAQLRGTPVGLVQFLEIATGAAGFEIVEQAAGSDGRPIPFHFVVRAPAAAGSQRALMERIIEREKPAHTTYALEIRTA